MSVSDVRFDTLMMQERDAALARNRELEAEVAAWRKFGAAHEAFSVFADEGNDDLWFEKGGLKAHKECVRLRNEAAGRGGKQ